MEELVIEARDLTKRYGRGVVAVDSVDMSVRRAEVYGFPGAQRGRQDDNAADVGGPVAGFAGVPYRRIDEVLDEVGLLDSANRRFATYSTGMKQRLSIAGALLKNPDLLILDEPTNGLDPQGMAEMRSLIRRLGQGEPTVLLSSHLLGVVEQICDRVGVISHGRLVRESTVKELRGSAGVLVCARPSDLARQMLTEMFGPEAVGQVDGALRVSTRPRAGLSASPGAGGRRHRRPEPAAEHYKNRTGGLLKMAGRAPTQPESADARAPTSALMPRRQADST